MTHAEYCARESSIACNPRCCEADRHPDICVRCRDEYNASLAKIDGAFEAEPIHPDTDCGCCGDLGGVV